MDQLQEMQAQIEQWKAMGVHSDAIQSAVQTAYAGGTTPLGLSQWSLGDKPRMEDFNRDNMRVDALIAELRGELERKANTAQPEINDLDVAPELINIDGARSYYYKNSLGEVVIQFSLATVNGENTIKGTNFYLFQMPEGFRPIHKAVFSVAANSMDPAVHVGGTCHLGTGGRCIVNVYNGAARYVHGSVLYLAAQ